MATEGLVNARTNEFAEVSAFEGYQIIEWHPTQDGTGPATAVCLVLPVVIQGERGSLMLRLKSERAVNEMIEALEKHRNGVWPKG